MPSLRDALAFGGRSDRQTIVACDTLLFKSIALPRKNGGLFSTKPSIDTYNFNPQLDKGDIVNIENWKTSVINEHQEGIEIGKQTFSFTAQVLDI